MAFPETPRTLYEINPLDEVVCQLKFPAILRIATETPASFQEAIRESFPYYRTESTVKVSIKLPEGIGPGRLPDLGAGLLGGKGQTHVFEASDRKWKITLAQDHLALTCRRYDRWENFRDRLASVLATLTAVYRPAFFVHVCLRYRDVIRPWLLDLPADVPWSELVQPWVSGAFGEPAVAGDVESVQTRTVVRLPNDAGRLDASYGLAVEQSSPRSVFLIDGHFYKDGQTEPGHVLSSLAILNRQAGLFFRWCISDRLHRALRPGSP